MSHLYVHKDDVDFIAILDKDLFALEQGEQTLTGLSHEDITDWKRKLWNRRREFRKSLFESILSEFQAAHDFVNRGGGQQVGRSERLPAQLEAPHLILQQLNTPMKGRQALGLGWSLE